MVMLLDLQLKKLARLKIEVLTIILAPNLPN